jgi:protein SCO1
MITPATLLRAIALAFVLTAPWQEVRAETAPPPEMASVDVVERPGHPVPNDLRFVDAEGRTVLLGQAFSGKRPVILTLVYFNCPMLCSTVLQGLTRALSSLGVLPGRDVDLVTVSFDPNDTPRDAAEKRRHYVQALGVPDATPVWSFLTGREPEIRALAEAVGFRYARIAHTSEFAHAAVIFVLTGQGTLSRYLYGIDFPGRDLRLALVEASNGRWGGSFDRFLLHCYRYDPATRRYQFYLSTYFRVGGLLLLSGLGGLIAYLLLRERRKRAAP